MKNEKRSKIEIVYDILKTIYETSDYNFWYTNSYRYLLNRKELGIRELPQHFYLINAMFLGINERKEDRLAFVKELYKMTATAEISLPTPTLLNARTPNSQLSSCFIQTPADSLDSIFHNITSSAKISKNWFKFSYLFWLSKN